LFRQFPFAFVAVETLSQRLPRVHSPLNRDLIFGVRRPSCKSSMNPKIRGLKKVNLKNPNPQGLGNRNVQLTGKIIF
jgi:hypothetical protein